MARIEKFLDTFDGGFIPTYPECPYAGEFIGNDCPCNHPKFEPGSYCGPSHVKPVCCPFDPHEELLQPSNIRHTPVAKMRKRYLPACHCTTHGVVLVNGILRCADCMGAYGTGASFYYSDEFLNDLISRAPQFGPEKKIQDCAEGDPS